MKVNPELCMRCGACAGVCQLDAVEATDGWVRANERCTDCGICAKICPVGAITVGKRA